MNRLLKAGRGHLLLGVACGLGMFALGASEARAETLLLTVSESVGGFSQSILDNSALDTNPLTGVIDVNVGLLNPAMNNYQFTALSASSNSPGTATVGSLSESGTAQLRLDGAGGSVTVMSSDISYSLPPGPNGALSSSSSSTFTHTAAGNNQTFTSWFNPPIATINQTVVAAPTVTNTSNGTDPNSQSSPTVTKAPVALAASYGLTNSATITLTGGTTGALSQDQFTGSTTVHASTIPEPASMALMFLALPVIVGAIRRRKAAQ
jgi:hypothetical protein